MPGKEAEYVPISTFEEVKKTIFKKLDKHSQKLDCFERKLLKVVRERNEEEAYERGMADKEKEFLESQRDALQARLEANKLSYAKLTLIIGAIMSALLGIVELIKAVR